MKVQVKVALKPDSDTAALEREINTVLGSAPPGIVEDKRFDYEGGKAILVLSLRRLKVDDEDMVEDLMKGACVADDIIFAGGHAHSQTSISADSVFLCTLDQERLLAADGSKYDLSEGLKATLRCVTQAENDMWFSHALKIAKIKEKRYPFAFDLARFLSGVKVHIELPPVTDLLRSVVRWQAGASGSRSSKAKRVKNFVKLITGWTLADWKKACVELVRGRRPPAKYMNAADCIQGIISIQVEGDLANGEIQGQLELAGFEKLGGLVPGAADFPERREDSDDSGPLCCSEGSFEGYSD